MSRYIDAEEFKKHTIKFGEEQNSQELASWLCQYIDCFSTADVVEVRHGEWKYYECVSSYEGCISGYACSVCNAFVEDEYFEAEEFHKKFCGNCGAKMDGERREE